MATFLAGMRKPASQPDMLRLRRRAGGDEGRDLTIEPRMRLTTVMPEDPGQRQLDGDLRPQQLKDGRACAGCDSSGKRAGPEARAIGVLADQPVTAWTTGVDLRR